MLYGITENWLTDKKITVFQEMLLLLEMFNRIKFLEMPLKTSCIPMKQIIQIISWTIFKIHNNNNLIPEIIYLDQLINNYNVYVDLYFAIQSVVIFELTEIPPIKDNYSTLMYNACICFNTNDVMSNGFRYHLLLSLF